MADVFLSYRRDDARGATGRLADHLQAALGADRVFRDVDSIAPGADFEAALQQAIGGASVLLAVIGPRWLDARDAAGRRRLDDPHDMVRRELESALAQALPVIPVLVEGARMPPADALPATLAPLARCQAVTLDDEGWRDDTHRLLERLRERHGVEPGPAATATAAASGTLLVDLLELLARPRRVIVRLAGQGGTREVQRAMLLLLACLLLGNLLLGAALDVGLAGWLANGTLLGLLAAAALAGLLALGWRVAGVRAGWQRTAAGTACLFGGAWLYVSAGLMMIVLGVTVNDPTVFTRLLALLRAGPPARAELDALVQARVHGPALAAMVLALATWAAGAVWLAAAWSALRLAYAAQARAAWVAAATATAVLAALGAAARWAAGA